MKTINNIAIVLLLLVGLPIGSHAQTEQFEMVLEKIDGTELSFPITDDYPVLQYRYGGEEGVNTLFIQTAEESTSVPCPDIKRLFTKVVGFISGDADGDGKVDVNDVTSTINHILKKSVAKFVKEAADVDGDKKIDVNDVQGIIDIALGKKK